MVILKKFTLFVLLLSSQLLHAQNDFCNGVNRAINDNEKLVFTVYYNLSALWVAAGDATFTTSIKKINGQTAFHVIGIGNTRKSYDWIFKVRDRYETYIDTNTLQPIKFIRIVNEGSYHKKSFTNFYHDRKLAQTEKGYFTTPTCVQDVLSTIYYARNIDYNKYKPGAKIPFSMFLDDEVYNLYIRYLGKERIKTKYGTFNAIKIAPLLIKGTIFDGGEDMRVWVSDDANHIPLRIESPILVGNIKADMMYYKNLKYPLTSLIKRR